ncbi:ABC transporter permease [Nonomuraea sp. LPB2021202275-12-8]|uniref:ABC transporter permease n=1 Tax=Nonomuraea sp. LPB2021202275-12-8 TaxID=3120159 RepID=UPI00300DB85A
MIPLPDPVRLRATDLAIAGLAGMRGRPLRAVLSALGVSIGIAAMVAVMGISTVSAAGLMAQIERLGTNLLTVTPGRSLEGGDSRLPTTAVGMVGRIPGVLAVSAVGRLPGASVRRTDKVSLTDTNGIAVAAARTDLLETLGATVRSGTFLNHATGRYPAVVLGSVAADRLGVARAGHDEQVYVAGRWLTVIGILDSTGLAPEIDRSALIGWTYAARLGFDGHPTTIYERSTDQSVKSVADVLAATAHPEHPIEAEVSRPSDALTVQLTAASAFDSLLLGLGAVALLVGAVGIANIMIISVLERRQEIGLRRSLGATRGQIRLQFLTESVAVSMLGGAAGVAIGLAVTLGYAAYRGWPLVLPGAAIAGGVLLSVLIGALAGLYPARRAARLAPTEALATI